MKPHRLIRFIIALLLGVSICPADLPAAPTTRPSTQAIEVRARRLSFLTRRSIELVKQGKLAEAETVLKEALQLSPGNSTNLYNMACMQALSGRPQAAMDYLERAAAEGFTDFIHIERDTDLNALRDLPRYKSLLTRKDELQRKAADRVVAWLKREFGDGYLYEIDDKNKLIFATNTDSKTLAALKNWLVAQAHSQWDQLFEHRPDQYISIVLPSTEDYHQIVSKPGVGGFYNHDNRILIAQRLGQVMTHEFTHALHGADLDPIGQEHPVWISEGLATLFESAQFEGDTLTPAENFRLTYVQVGARTNRLIPLERLLNMDQKAFVANATYAYGQSGSLMLYLYEQGLLRKFYDTYKADYDHDKTGKAALESATGRPLARLEKDWKEWMLHRKPPPANTGPDGAVLGVHFIDANDGLRIESITPGGPAALAGLQVDDVLIGIGDTEVRDQQSILPVLGLHSPGDKVVLKIRRQQKYLDLPLTLGKRADVAKGVPNRPASKTPAVK